MLRPSIFLIAILLGLSGGVFAQTLFPVPNIAGVCGVSGVIVSMSGGSGGASNSSGTGFPDGGAGGRGGAIVCTLDVANPVEITSLTYYVGMAGGVGLPVYVGTTGAAGGTGYGHGGNAGNFTGPSGFVGTDVSGGGGGGSSAVLNTSGGTVLLVAAGGGGGGALTPSVVGGAGGATGANGGSYSPNFGGTGGTPGVFGAAGGAGVVYPGMAAGAAAPGDGGNGGTGQTGSQSGGGGGAGWGGGGGGGSGNTVFAGVNTITAGGGGGANYVNPTAITTGLSNGTATASGNGAVSLTIYPAIATTTGVNFCSGQSSTFTESTPGGVWSSSDPSIATVSSSTGISVTVTGVSMGTANISYTMPSGYWSFVTVTINPGAGPITGPSSVCVGQTISLSDTSLGGTWSSGATGIATVSATGGIVTGVSAGTAGITYTMPSGCNATTTITVNPFPAPIGGPAAVCIGNVTTLTDAVTGGVWSSLDPGIATIDPVSGAITGVTPGSTTITYGFAGMCTVNTPFTVNQLPVISSVESTNPTTCGGMDGTISLNGLDAGTSYLVNYDFNGNPAPALTIPANGTGQVVINVPITGLLGAGTYSNIYVTNAVTGCVSLPAGPITLSDPPNPPAPTITSQPICDHQTLYLSATDAWSGGTYSWSGPNGFSSNLQEPYIINTTYSNTGVYTVIYTHLNCQSPPSTINITIQPPPQLANVTTDHSIPYGGSIRLYADNALYYTWAPDDGTLSNPNINNPIASPVVTTTYTVYGMNQFGCRDTAYVTISVDSVLSGIMPTAFTPNGDGHNDVFRPLGFEFHHLVEFRVYNRWGQQVYYTTNMKDGWDGTYNGVPQEMGTYYYQVIVARPDGMEENMTYRGSVTLIR